MTDNTRTPLTGDPEIDALVAEIEGCLDRWGLLIEEQQQIAHMMLDLAAIDEEFLP
jgi:hypothetical protein